MSKLTNALLVGFPTQAKLFSANPNSRPHYHILVKTENQQFDIAVNIASEDSKTSDVRVLYAIKRNIVPPQADALRNLTNGMFELPADGITGIDFVRDHLVTKDEMKPLPLFNRSQPIETQGSEEIKQVVDEVVADPKTVVYAFGHRYERRSSHSQNGTWGFEPDDGIHNIHMNQGNYTGNHDDENGRGEDGALFIHFPDTNIWYAIYIAFQTQSFDNDSDGYPKGDSKHTANHGGDSQGKHPHH